MPLTKSGSKVMAGMKKQYGSKAKQVFYASVNKGVAGSEKWHEGGSMKSKKKMVMHMRANKKG